MNIKPKHILISCIIIKLDSKTKTAINEFYDDGTELARLKLGIFNLFIFMYNDQTITNTEVQN